MEKDGECVFPFKIGEEYEIHTNLSLRNSQFDDLYQHHLYVTF